MEAKVLTPEGKALYDAYLQKRQKYAEVYEVYKQARDEMLKAEEALLEHVKKLD